MSERETEAEGRTDALSGPRAELKILCPLLSLSFVFLASRWMETDLLFRWP